MASSAPSWCFSALRTLALTAAICSVFASALYEDEAGVRDWTMRNIGAVSFAAYHPSKGVVFAATDEHVLAGIDMKTGELRWRNVLPEKQIFDDVAVCKRKVIITASSSPSAHDTTIRAWTLDGELVWNEYRARVGNQRCAVRCAESGDSADAVLVHCGKDIHVLSLAKGSSLRHIAAREGVTSVFVSSSEGWVYMLGSGGFEKVKLMAWDEKHEGALPEDAVVSESAAIVETEEGTTFAVFPSASSASDVHVISLSEDAGSAARVVAGVDVDTIAAAGSFVRIKTKSTGQFRYFSIDASTKALTAHAKPTGFGASDAFDESMLFTLEAKGADIQLSARAMGSDAKLTRRYRAKIGRTVDLLARGSVVTMLPRVSQRRCLLPLSL